MENNDLLWKQYQQHIEAYKFYLDIVVKLMSFYFAVTGAMLSFYFSNSADTNAKLALYLPLLMGVGLLIIFIIGAILSLITRKDIFILRDKMKLETAPETGILTLLLVVFSFVLIFTIIGIIKVALC